MSHFTEFHAFFADEEENCILIEIAVQFLQISGVYIKVFILFISAGIDK